MSHIYCSLYHLIQGYAILYHNDSIGYVDRGDDKIGHVRGKGMEHGRGHKEVDSQLEKKDRWVQ